MFAGSAFDLIVADGYQLGRTAGPSAEHIVRSVAVAGGPISDHFYEAPGGSTTPWLVSATLGTVALLNMSTGKQQPITGANIERISCSPDWCG